MQGRTARYFLLCLGLVVCPFAAAANRAPDAPMHLGKDFPSSEAYYPKDLAAAGIEGVAIIHYCVSAQGRLSDTPQIEESSGNSRLDDAAVELAKAGSYVPTHANGQPLPGCDSFRVKFALKDDPAFPSLSRRARALNRSVYLRTTELQAQLTSGDQPVDLWTLNVADPNEMQQLRQHVAIGSNYVALALSVTGDYLSQMDDLGRSDDVPQAERDAFTRYWLPLRSHTQQLREGGLDAGALLKTLQELIELVDQASLPVARIDADTSVSPQQRAWIDAVLRRAQQQFSKIRGRIGKEFQLPEPYDTATPLPNPGAARANRLAEYVLEAIEDHPYDAGTMIDVAMPHQIDESGPVPELCHYPDTAKKGFEEGTTVFMVQLNAQGRVTATKLRRSSGFEDLDATTEHCLASAVFQPATQQGAPVASQIQVSFPWYLEWDASGRSCAPQAPSVTKQVIVCSCHENSGRLIPPRVIGSSGNSRLDAGAIKIMEHAGPRPPGHGGCEPIRVTFTLKDQHGNSLPNSQTVRPASINPIPGTGQ
jgi:TonB family protein